MGDDEDDWATATVDDLIQQGRQRKEDAAREREELEQQRGELETLESFAVFGCFWSFFFLVLKTYDLMDIRVFLDQKLVDLFFVQFFSGSCVGVVFFPSHT